jgi:hypothetical protein
MTEADAQFDRQAQHLLVIDTMVTASLIHLLSISDPNHPVYAIGRNLFSRHVTTTTTSLDVLVSTPLERAYLWTFACLWSKYGRIELGNRAFAMQKPSGIHSGRLFPKNYTSNFAPGFFYRKDTPSARKPTRETMRDDVIYYALEGSQAPAAGKSTRSPNNTSSSPAAENPSHPLCDIFFKALHEESGRPVLVMVDVTGADKRAVSDKPPVLTSQHAQMLLVNGKQRVVDFKSSRLNQWIAEQKGQGKSFKDTGIHAIYGVVLAPNAAQGVFKPLDYVDVVCGDDARKLLGGLQQVFRWMVPKPIDPSAASASTAA